MITSKKLNYVSPIVRTYICQTQIICTSPHGITTSTSDTKYGGSIFDSDSPNDAECQNSSSLIWQEDGNSIKLWD